MNWKIWTGIAVVLVIVAIVGYNKGWFSKTSTSTLSVVKSDTGGGATKAA